MDEEKLCPILYASADYKIMSNCICLKEQCAWWIEDKQKCAIAVLGIEHKKKG